MYSVDIGKKKDMRKTQLFATWKINEEFFLLPGEGKSECQNLNKFPHLSLTQFNFSVLPFFGCQTNQG